MLRKQIFEEAKGLEQELIKNRRFLHENAETGFDLDKTVEYVENELKNMGYSPVRCGRAGLVATVGKTPAGGSTGKVFMIRGDMDALPITEDTGLEFASDSGRMHACGHDMHTSMMLGAAKLLKQHEGELNGCVKLMFQPAEEIFEGSNDMIQNGLLENPSVDAAMMIHVMANTPFAPGTVIVSSPGVSAPAADYFEIKVQGCGCHGSMPNTGVDPINAASHIVLALQEINARELSVSERAVVTIGTINGGNAANVIPDSVVMGGTIRTYDEETRAFIKNRITEIAEGTAKTFRASAQVAFGSGCPTLKNDAELSEAAFRYAEEILGKEKAYTVEQLTAMAGAGSSSKSAGSEDFAYVSQKVPSIMLALAAGQPDKGYCYPQHHPKVMFDEEALCYGSMIYTYVAMRWLEENGK
jgi:hippurate hydrolase